MPPTSWAPRISARSPAARGPTSSCSTPIPSPTSATRRRSGGSWWTGSSSTRPACVDAPPLTSAVGEEVGGHRGPRLVVEEDPVVREADVGALRLGHVVPAAPRLQRDVDLDRHREEPQLLEGL